LYYEHLWSTLNNSLSMCIFLPYSHAQMVDLVAGVTGWQTSEWELAKAAERSITLARLFNLREGLRREDDRLPKRFFKPIQDGTLGRIQLNQQDMDRALTLYYEMMGWDGEQGIPKDSKLHELDIAWALGAMPG
jgi:aldehyde:ferredoxin oxidoreductase